MERTGVFTIIAYSDHQAATVELNSLRWAWLLDIGTDDFADRFLATTNVGFINDMTYAVKSGKGDPAYMLYNAFTRPWLKTDPLVKNHVGTWSGAGTLLYNAPQRKYSLDGSVLKGAFF
ncbi:unnamed protein product, partial [Nesidiocoris tenuis]